MKTKYRISNNNDRRSIMELVNSKEAAKLLDIPELALGQCLFEEKLKFVSGFRFNKDDVMTLKTNQTKYLKPLK